MIMNYQTKSKHSFLKKKVKKKFFDYIWSFLKGQISEDLKMLCI
jgi:hypothetical protein